jgi:dTDP-4-amino-4,6-dideoxygalactose transaminase
MTFAASINVIEHVGATPILVDIEPDTLNIDPNRIEAAITKRTRAILPVHYAGHPADMAAILQITREHDLFVIEDAAHALTARYQQQYVGTFGDFAAFSFYATKNLTTGEGGMLVGSPERIARARLLSLHGMTQDAWSRDNTSHSWAYEVVEPGYKYNMTDMQAALGLVQFERLAEMQRSRQRVWETYDRAFSEQEALQPPTMRADVDHAYHLYVLRLNLDQLTINRSQFVDALTERNIGSSVHFIPLHLHQYYRNKYGFADRDFPVAFDEFQRIVSLPLYPDLDEDDLEDVITAVRDIVDSHSC